MWPRIKKGKAPRFKQIGKGSYHAAKEIKKIQVFDPKVIARLRACTFKDRSYAYFIHNGLKIYIGIKFFIEEDINKFDRKNHA